MKKQFNIDTKRDILPTINKYYPGCDISTYLRLKKITEFKSVKSDKQIKTVLCLGREYKIRQYHDRLILLLSKHVPIKYLKKIIYNYYSDIDIYVELRKYIRHRPKKSLERYKKHYLPCDGYVRFAQRVNYLVRNQILNKDPKFKLNNYLDIGCGDCIKTKLIGDLLELNSNKVYGADIPSWSIYSQKERKKLPINIIDLEINKKLPIKSNTFNLISAYMVLHHIKNLKLILKEINRILKIGSYLIIKEHDAINSIDYMLADIEHALYDVVYNEDERFIDEHYGEYYDQFEWNWILSKFGFKCIYTIHVYSNIDLEPSPTRGYIGIYQKIKNIGGKKK